MAKLSHILVVNHPHKKKTIYFAEIAHEIFFMDFDADRFDRLTVFALCRWNCTRVTTWTTPSTVCLWASPCSSTSLPLKEMERYVHSWLCQHWKELVPCPLAMHTSAVHLGGESKVLCLLAAHELRGSIHRLSVNFPLSKMSISIANCLSSD